MQRSDLSERQIQERGLVYRGLTEVGWTDGAYVNNKWFDEGLYVHHEVSLEYCNSNMISFVLHYNADEAIVYLSSAIT